METNHETVLLLSDLDDFYIQFNNFVKMWSKTREDNVKIMASKKRRCQPFIFRRRIKNGDNL